MCIRGRIIATPDRLHAEQAIAAAAAGKHVLVEKPMATSVDEADAMVAACRAAGVQLGVAYHMRWHLGTGRWPGRSTKVRLVTFGMPVRAGLLRR